MKVEDSIHIEASPDIVWHVTREVERWPEWTPTVTSAVPLDQGPFGLGSVVRVKQPMQPEAQWVVTAFDEGRRFAWESRRPGMRFTASHELVGDDSGTTNILRVEAEGMLVMLLRPLLGMALPRALADENRGLKARCESIARGGADETEAARQ
ncbi:MAG TPA: SRPBCC family protein [Arenicellales bacterium]|nr:SRPBCC family protein [Arenicellales bacterium]